MNRHHGARHDPVAPTIRPVRNLGHGVQAKCLPDPVAAVGHDQNSVSSPTVRRHARRHVKIAIQFFSYFKELTGVDRVERDVAEGTTLGALHEALCRDLPGLREMNRATLLAVGVDYQPRGFVLKEGDVVSLFPPVQGG